MFSSFRSSTRIHQVLAQLDPSKRSGRTGLQALMAAPLWALQQLQPARSWKVVDLFGVPLLAGALSALLTFAVLSRVPLDSPYLPTWVLLSFAGFGVSLVSVLTYLRDAATWTEFNRQFKPLTDELALAVQAVDIIDRCPECKAYRDAVVARRPMVYRDLEALRLLETEVSASDVSEDALSDEQFRETIFRELRQVGRGPRAQSPLTLENPCLT